MRPLRCSRRLGFHGISKWIIREQWFWRSMPSEAASVASRMRTGLCFGSVWKAALIRSRSFESIPPYIVMSRSPSVSPSAARTPCSQFCVARYSVKMMTRSSDHLPPGRMCSSSQRISPLALASSWEVARSAQAFISFSSDSSSGDGSRKRRPAASRASWVASSASSSTE